MPTLCIAGQVPPPLAGPGQAVLPAQRCARLCMQAEAAESTSATSCGASYLEIPTADQHAVESFAEMLMQWTADENPRKQAQAKCCILSIHCGARGQWQCHDSHVEAALCLQPLRGAPGV